ncbi:MAG: phospho-N-acetylmuramoyl-pentapeptide-transferase [Cyanobacteriota bacterium]
MSEKLFIYQIYILMGLVSGLAIFPFMIKMLKQFKARQTIRKEGPEEHKVKQGTPTMGGIGIIVPVLILTLFICRFSTESLLLCFTVFCFFMIGFIDDALIVMKGKNDGLRPKIKLVLQILSSIIFGLGLQYLGHKPILNIPFTNTFIDIGLLYIPAMAFIMTGTSNAVNLTDGLDGLASGVTAISLISLVVMLAFSNPSNMTFAGIVMGLVCIGTCISFLWFNSYPAEVFMGDTGSLALGGLFSSLAIIGNNELWLPFAGIIFVLETLSVIIQVSYYKRTKKRVFLMTPIHHHFEKKGLRETKISFRFYIVSLLAALFTSTSYLYFSGN